MTPPPPAATAAGRLRGGAAPRVPRRVSGPAARPRTGAPRVRTRARARRRAGAARAASAAAVLRGLPDARLLDRLLRGRAWIALIAVALIGIVFMQVSLLKLNAGIGRAVTTVDTLERQNAELRADVAALAGDGRIQDVAAEAGLVLPPAGDVEYRDARRANARRAVRAISPPDHDRAAEVTAPAQPSTVAAAPAGVTEPAAPVTAVAPESSTPATATAAAPAAAAPTTPTTPTTPATTPATTTPATAPAPAEGTATSVAGAVAAPAGGG
jgi:cell division protein FtsL